MRQPSAGTSVLSAILFVSLLSFSSNAQPGGPVSVTNGSTLTMDGPETVTQRYPATVGWIATNPLPTATWSPSMAVLPSGKVLVAGGYGSGTRPHDAQIYDPASGTWATTTPLPSGHSINAVRLMPDALRATIEILVVGDDEAFPTGLGHVYNESAAAWTATGPTNVRRYLPATALLPSGEVLMAGGYIGGCCYGDFGNYETAEIYNRGTNTWTTTGSMATKRAAFTATPLPNGKVMAAGGSYRDTETIWNSVEIYDRTTQTWSLAMPMITARSWHTATLLLSGKVMVVGGWHTSFNDFNATAELYDPALNTWSFTGSLATPRAEHTATLLPTGKVLVAGGRNRSGVLRSAEIYDPATGLWSPAPDMIDGRARFAATLLPNGQVMAVVGYDRYDPPTGMPTVPTANAELYHVNGRYFGGHR